MGEDGLGNGAGNGSGGFDVGFVRSYLGGLLPPGELIRHMLSLIPEVALRPTTDLLMLRS